VPQRPAILPDRPGRRYGHPVSDEPAYRSRLTLRTGPSAGPSHPRPGNVTDAEDPELAALRDAVVVPVAAVLLTADELERVTVHRGIDGDEGEVWVRVVAAGEVFEDRLASPLWPLTTAECAVRLAGHLQDWIAESRFGWGQLRPVTPVLPGS